MRDVERRFVFGNVSVRAKDASGSTRLEGYAAVFDQESEDLGGFREVVRRTAFDRSLREGADVLARAHHDSQALLGRTSSGTLRLLVDGRGLKYTVDLPDTSDGRDVGVLVSRGDIRQSSFAFFLPPTGGDVWQRRASDGLPLRELVDVDLFDVAPVVTPAYPQTQVSARALESARGAVASAGAGTVPLSTFEALLRLHEQ